MCGEDGTQRGLYKLKEEHAEKRGDSKRKERKTQKKEGEQKERKRTVLITKEKDRCANSKLSIYVRVNLFMIQKLTYFFTPTLYKLYCLGFFTCEPNTVTGRYKSRPYNWRRLWEELTLAWRTSGATFLMEEVGPHHPATGPQQENVNLHQAESRGSQHGGPRRSPERREGHEGSVRTTHTTRSHSRGKSHVSQEKHEGNLQREIADLKRELRHARRERSPSCSEPSTEESDGNSYRRRSRTPPSKTFSYEEEHRHRRKRRSSTSRGLGNDAMNKALSQISKSPFTRNIDDTTHP